MSNHDSDGSKSQTPSEIALELIIEKLSNAPVLNGGFETLVQKVDHLAEKTEETSEKVDKISEALYEPDTGLFARLKTVEDNSVEHKDIMDQREVTKKLTRIAGEDLDGLKSIISAGKKLERLWWIILPIAGSYVFRLVYELGSTYLFHK